MAELYGSHFEYGDQSSHKYGLIIATADTEQDRSVAAEMSSKLIYNKKNTRHYIVSNDYSSPTSFDVNILTDEGQVLSFERRREIEKWLFNRANYYRFYLDLGDDPDDETGEIIDGELKRLYLNCRFLNPERLFFNGGLVGWKATLEADSPMWWQDEIIKSLPITTNTTLFSINVDTDIDDYIYPTIVFQTSSTGSPTPSHDRVFAWKNNTDDPTRTTRFTGLTSDIIVTVNSANNYVSGQNYLKMSERNFPRLLDGDNEIIVVGDITSLTVTYSNRRFR